MGKAHAGPGLALLEGAPASAGDAVPGENPGLDVLADIFLAAVEADRVSETYELLADLVGERAVRQAHEITMQRLSDAVGAAAAGAATANDGATAPGPEPGPPPVGEIDPSDDARSLLQSIRATAPVPAGVGA